MPQSMDLNPKIPLGWQNDDPHRQLDIEHNKTVLNTLIEDLSGTLLRSIPEARELMETNEPKAVSKRSAAMSLLRSFRKRDKAGEHPDKSTVTIRLFESVDGHIQKLYTIASFDGCGIDPLLEIINILQPLASYIEAVLLPLRTVPRLEEDILAALRVFNEQGEKWVSEASSFESNILHTNGASNVVISSQRPPSPSNGTSENIVKNSSIVLCPLEVAVSQSKHKAATSRNFADFFHWAVDEGIDSVVHQRVGFVQSVHLYRERSIIHHEFAIISFGGPDITTSWLRLERAARFKNQWHMLQADSLGPLFGGATLRETVTYSASRDTLVGSEVDELAYITIGTATSAIDTRVSLHDLGAQIRSISSTYPKYQLFTANCRYFARRTLLSFAQRLTAVGSTDYTFSWEGASASFDIFYDNIQKDLFGGRQLEGGPNGAFLRADNLLGLARVYLDHQRTNDALSTCIAVHKILLDTTSQSADDIVLRASAYTTLFRSLKALGVHRDALSAALAARDLVQSIRSQPSQWNLDLPLAAAYSNIAVAYSNLNQLDNAIDNIAEAITIWRTIREVHPKQYTIDLARSLHNLADLLITAGGYDQATMYAQEALAFVRGLYAERPDLHRASLAYALSNHGIILCRIGNTAEAYRMEKESTSLHRESFEIRPDAFREDLAHGLYNQALSAADLGLWDEACAAGQEAITLRRQLFAVDPNRYRAKLAAALHNWAEDLWRAGRRRESLAPGWEAIWLRRTLFAGEPEVYQQDLMQSSENVAKYLLSLGEEAEADNLMVEAMQLLTES